MGVTTAHAATATEVASDTADAQGVVATEGLRLLGWSVKETAGTPAAATLTLRNGTSDTDPVIGYVNLSAGEGQTVFLGEAGIQASGGIYVDRLSGTTAIVLYTRVGE